MKQTVYIYDLKLNTIINNECQVMSISHSPFPALTEMNGLHD